MLTATTLPPPPLHVPPLVDSTPPIHLGHGEGMWHPKTRLGANRTHGSSRAMLCSNFMHRGECTFVERLVNAGRAGASCIIVISNQDLYINPSRRQTWTACLGGASAVWS
ncbi:hypothetical protein FOMPIDRAFT_1025893 [Fomitopsis schrenkii]|uniref:PA domain-containing protein n=1 Tax=Fomitopsis schrenkii TaxID=2126942 RepID=S8F091_FOMSC|nr:hypothetical protein FOMPIDRAFT_1025893 [Fomitopsis schrenkii]